MIHVARRLGRALDSFFGFRRGMRNLLSALLILCSLAVIGLPQQKKNLASDDDIRISKDQPTIYITFVRSGKREPVHNSESKEGVWLRLHNNTKWTLLLEASGAGGKVFARGDEEEVGMYYGVEVVPEPQ